VPNFFADVVLAVDYS